MLILINLLILDMVLDLMYAEVLILTDGSSCGKNKIMFGADMSSFVNIQKKKKDLLILDKGPANGLVDSTLTVQRKHSIVLLNNKKNCFSLHYKRVNRKLGEQEFGNGVEIYRFKAKVSEINAAPL